jgi:hypothetical protein
MDDDIKASVVFVIAYFALVWMGGQGLMWLLEQTGAA